MHAGIAAIMKMMSKQMLFSHVYQASSSRKWFSLASSEYAENASYESISLFFGNE